MGSAAGDARTVQGDFQLVIPQTVTPPNLDGERFRVLRLHARGGLGAVHVALDRELNREVALKQILEKHADDPVSRQRFLLEAEVTGGLEHPGIVPVYALGSDANGRPYYAMRFIRGDSLKEAIDRFHQRTNSPSHPAAAEGKADSTPGQPPAPTASRDLEFRKLLRRFIDVCNAIDYAHSRGVLHRDIKPTNIIVGKHGETLVVDWGLAKATGKAEAAADERMMLPSSASGSSETLPGSTLGTPAYMSPEQAHGDLERLGPPSDVYSLGGTLYCLLTGTPPLDGFTVAEMLRRVKAGEIISPRRHDPAIDPALEAVCMKAMAMNPADRYASPRLLAEDLERWMADEPVSAYHDPWTRKLTRWLGRHRTGVTAAGAAVVVALVGTAAVMTVQAVDNARLSASLGRESMANSALATTNAELTRAKEAVQARYDLAVDAIKTFHTGVSEDFLLREPKFKDLRDRLLESASDFYEKLGSLLGKETDTASRRALASAEFEVASLTGAVGRTDLALAAHRRVLAAREALPADPQATDEIKGDVGRSLTAIASLLDGTGKTDEAIATYRKADSLLAGADSPAPVCAALADCRSRLGYLLYTAGHAADGLKVLVQARSDQDVLARDNPADPDAERDLASTINRIANILSRTGKTAEAQAQYKNAMAIYQKLSDRHPSITEYRLRLAFTHNNLGGLLKDIGKLAEAEAEFRSAMAIRQKLVDANPAVTDFQNSLAQGHRNLGKVFADRGRTREAEAEYQAAIAMYQELAGSNPSVIDFPMGLADCYASLALMLYQIARPADAVAAFRSAMTIRLKLAEEGPTLPQVQSDLAQSHHNLGYLLADMGQLGEAVAEYRKALPIYQKLVVDNPTVPRYRDSLANSHLDLGIALAQTGQLGAAEAAQRAAIALYEKLAAENPDAANHQFGLGGALYNLGDVLRSLGRAADAKADYNRSVDIFERLVKKRPIPWFRGLLAHAVPPARTGRGRARQPGAGRGRCPAIACNLRRLADAFRRRLVRDRLLPRRPGGCGRPAPGFRSLRPTEKPKQTWRWSCCARPPPATTATPTHIAPKPRLPRSAIGLTSSS